MNKKAEFDYERFLVKKDENTDMLSSLKKLDLMLLDEAITEYDVDTAVELSKEIVENFITILEQTCNDPFTILFMYNLIKKEGTDFIVAHQSDIEDFFVFVYEEKDIVKYYIPDEIKKEIFKYCKEAFDRFDESDNF